MAIDVGTGDGRAVLAAAAREPRALVIGLDPVAPAMAEASRRAARGARRGGVPNARFVVAAAESIPDPLRGIAASVTVSLPWGSLLRGCLGAEAGAAGGLVSLLAPGGTLELLLAPAAPDRLDGLPTEPTEVIAAARTTFEAIGLACLEGRAATADEIRASTSTWARRLLGGAGSGARASSGRSVVLVRFRSP